MEITIGGISATAEFVRYSRPSWGIKGWLHPMYRITITGPNGASETFTFWASHQDYLDRKTALTTAQLGDAVSCILEDGYNAYDSPADFASEYGYEIDEAERLLGECAETATKLERIGFSVMDMTDIGALARDIGEAEA